MVDSIVLQLVSQCFDVVLEIVPLCLILEVGVSRSDAPLCFLEDPHFVESDHALLESLEVQVFREERLMYIVFELALLPLLVVDHALHLARCFRETFLPHPQVVNNQHEVLIDFIEVFLL